MVSSLKSNLKRLLSLIVSLLLLATCICIDYPVGIDAKAVSVDYPAQLVRISTYDNSRNLNITGYSDNSACNTWNTNGVQNENWRFDYVGANSVGSFFKITNMGTGRLLTPLNYNVAEGTSCVIYGSESATSQHWYITAVSQDSYGNNLYYKITNYDNSNLALTYNSSSNTITLSAYTGADNQKWLLNTAGLQGFAGYCTTPDGAVKAGTIGGLLGEIVEVTTFDELKAACTSTEPATIVITSNISGVTGTSNYEISTGYDGGNRYYCKDNYIYLQPNKTIIGSYSANTLHNVYFRTYNENYGPAYDVIIRNINCTHDTELNTDNIWEFAYGWNFWIDHCTFEGHDAINTCSLGSTDWDKFLNFKGTSDYVTISDCKFGLHEYGVLLGYPSDDETTYNTYNGQPCVTLANNYYKDTVTRAPALMRYGYFHSLNNYVYNFSMGYTVHSACKTFAEACYYEQGGSVICDWNQITYPGAYAEENSVFVNVSRTVQGEGTTSNPSYSIPCTWRPTSNYSYTALTAEEAKTYCEAYSGAQSSRSNITYAMYAEPGVPSASYVVAPDETSTGTDTEVTAAVIDTTLPFMLKDVNSGLYMDVAGGTAANSTNVQQWGADSAASYNTWKAVDAGDGYYYLYSQVGDGQTYLLDVTGAKAADGTNIIIYQKSGSNAQMFKFVKNSDGSYTILTKCSSDASCVEVADASTAAGANVQQWQLNGHACQNWIIEYVEPTLIAGDVNLDEVVNCVDLLSQKRGIINGFDSEYLRRCADVNNDASVNSSDVKALGGFLLRTNTHLVLGDAQDDASSYEPDNFSFSGNVYLVGDSTVCEYSSTYTATYNRYGWGMKLADEYNNVNVTNLALSGRSSRSFLSETNYTTLCNSIGKGDYLFIQFGHNDEKTDESTYPGLGTYPMLVSYCARTQNSRFLICVKFQNYCISLVHD